MEPLLVLDGVKVHFGGVKAVDGVSIRIEPGRLYGLVGPNGSGKTTLVNAITRLTRLTEGSITFDGRDVTRRRPHDVARAGMRRTFQGIRLIPTLTVRQNVLLGTDNLGKDGHGAAGRAGVHAADEAIERLELQAYASTYPSNLSYGTQRRVEIARSLAGSPRMLLLDEPVAGMSREERGEISAVVRSLREQGLTQLLIEHDLRMIQELSDHMFVMNFGKLVAEGEPRATAELPVVQQAYLGRTRVLA